MTTRKTLFDILVAITQSGQEKEILPNTDAIVKFAASMNVQITVEMAHSIKCVGNLWAMERKNPTKDLDEIRQDVEQQLICFVHEHTDDVAPVVSWRRELFGLIHLVEWDTKWLNEAHYLHETSWDTEALQWLEV